MAPQAWRCTRCGTVNEPDADACRGCGRWVSLFDQDDIAARSEGGLLEPVVLRTDEVSPAKSIRTPRRWKGLLSTLVTIAVFVAIVLANFVAPRLFDDVDPVTPEKIEDTAGSTRQLFAKHFTCDVYVVPVDRLSEPRAAGLASTLSLRAPRVTFCATVAFRLDASFIDERRRQLYSPEVLYRLKLNYRSVWGAKPATIIALTELDMVTTDWPGTWVTERRQGFAAISTARLGSGADLDRRLEIMGMRYVGFAYYGLPGNRDPRSALYPTIRELEDLDRMQQLFSDPPPTEAELRAARKRFLDG